MVESYFRVLEWADEYPRASLAMPPPQVIEHGAVGGGRNWGFVGYIRSPSDRIA